MLYAKAQLFSILIPKNIAAMIVHLDSGTLGWRKVYAAPASNCVRYAKQDVKTNWKNVMTRPVLE